MGRRDVSAYIASKMGGIGLARALASDLGPFGITANAVAPGFMRTEGTAGKFEGDFDALARSRLADESEPGVLVELAKETQSARK